MHKGNSSPDNTITSNPQVEIPIKAESTAAMCGVWYIETMQYGGFPEAAGS